MNPRRVRVNKGWLCGACLSVAASAAVPPPELPPLQPLVDSTPTGSVLRPPPGRYAGPVVIDRTMQLDGRGEVTLDGQGRGTVLIVRAPGARVTGVQVERSGALHDQMDAAVRIEADGVTFAHSRVTDALFGVFVKAARDTLVCGNVIGARKADEPGMRGDGVRVWNGANNRVFGNDIDGTRDVTLANTHDNAVVQNRIRHGRFGMQLVFAPRSRIERNWIDGNLTGVAVLYSDEVTLRGNRVQNSPGVSGIGFAFKESSQAVVENNAVIHCAVGARANSPTHPLNVLYFRRNLFAHNVAAMDFYGENGGHVIEGNRFEHNLVPVSVSAPMSARGNAWKGNQWDDYLGFDRDHDGVGDVPHDLYWFADRIFLEEPRATFFRNTPMLELVDFLERLAPFASPELILEDPRPHVGEALRVAAAEPWAPFVPACPEEVR